LHLAYLLAQKCDTIRGNIFHVYPIGYKALACYRNEECQRRENPSVKDQLPPNSNEEEEVADEQPAQCAAVDRDDVPQRYEAAALTDEDFETMLAQDAARIVPGLGNDGVGVTLEGEEKELADEMMAKEAFNIVLSNKIALNRTVPDPRHQL
jgi:hypothetical protein